MRDKRSRVERAVAAEAARARELALTIHELAEAGFREVKSAALLAGYLRERGFRVEFPFRRIPTAFRAVRGRGRPAVGILGEYDALPDCGPKPGEWGHGCGHDLLGVASAVGAVAAAEVLGRRGAIIYYGCPAEEALAGKAFMARDGAFRDIDACLAWHPSSVSRVMPLGGSALDSLRFDFRGITAHGASAHNGRSALDGVMLTDVAANYLREHVPENVRIHMVVPAGGQVPNVVPASAQAWYFVRGRDRRQVDEVRERLIACARGAALSTGTSVRVRRTAGIHSRLANASVAKVLRANLELFGAARAAGADLRRARRLNPKATFKPGLQPDQTVQERASTDEDTVSWLAPLGRFDLACFPEGLHWHHRELAAQGKLPFAGRGMLQAAKVLAGATLDLATDRGALRGARAEFRKGTKGFRFDPLVARGQKLPAAPA
jgi:aminobenzoyl-glutamate utilization protein B